MVLTKRDLSVAATGGHNIVTYFPNATKLGTHLRGAALRSDEPGAGRTTSVSAMLAGLLYACFRRTAENILGPTRSPPVDQEG